MASQLDRTPLYDGSGRLQIDNLGNVVLQDNGIQSEILERIRSIRGTNIYDSDYGSELPLLLNSRVNSTGLINSWVLQALQPMVDADKITSDILVSTVLIGNGAKIEVTTTAVGGEEITAIFSSFLLT